MREGHPASECWGALSENCMKLTYEFDENEIIEKVKEDSEGYSSLKEEIIREIKQRVVHKFVSQIESETVDRSYSRE